MVDVRWVRQLNLRFFHHVAVCQNLVPLVNIKIAGKWMFIPLKMVLIGIDPYPCLIVKPLETLLFYVAGDFPKFR